MVRKKLSKGLLRNAVEKYTSEKKLHKKSLSWNVFFLNDTVISGSTEERKKKRKTHLGPLFLY